MMRASGTGALKRRLVMTWGGGNYCDSADNGHWSYQVLIPRSYKCDFIWVFADVIKLKIGGDEAIILDYLDGPWMQAPGSSQGGDSVLTQKVMGGQ